jgi:hypothetical protein
LTAEEFNQLTLSQYDELEDRRAIGIRYGRFNAGLVASFIFNASGAASEGEAIEPWDFLPGYEDEEGKEKERERRRMRLDVKKAIMRVATRSPEEVRKVTDTIVQRLRDNGVEDPEDLIREVFPEMRF